jgi:hypothetical protein
MAILATVFGLIGRFTGKLLTMSPQSIGTVLVDGAVADTWRVERSRKEATARSQRISASIY